MLKPIVFVVGPTGVGKTSISVKLAKSLNAEIISADSMQVYKSMDIGTAKVTQEEMQGVRHHLIDVCDASKEFSVYDFCEKALIALKDIDSRGKLAVVAGGTGLYVRSFIQGLFEQPAGNEKLRSLLEKEAEEIGSVRMHEKLKTVDPTRADQIHPHQLRRVIRALEIFEISKNPASALKQKTASLQAQGYQPFVFGITLDREKLYARINERVDLMFEQGLLDEVKKLSSQRISKTARQAVGYKEILDWIELESSINKNSEEFSRVRQLIQQKSRNLAKRQWTWFKKEENIIWFDQSNYDDENEIVTSIVSALKSTKK